MPIRSTVLWKLAVVFLTVLGLTIDGHRRLTVTAATGLISVTTNHNDNARTGANLSETQLSTTTVGSSSFGKLFSYDVDEFPYAQPLYLPGVTIPGKGTHNVVYVATVNDSVYAFDADSDAGANASPLWKVNFTNPAAGITAPPYPFTPDSSDGPLGIFGTPVIDESTGTMYLVARTVEQGQFFQRLHALDVTTGAEKLGGPVVITATVPGTGYDSAHGQVQFNPQTQNQRAGLALANGMVYICWAAVEDANPYHGWILAYDAGTLQRVAAFNTTPDGGQGGIWHSGQPPAIDGNGNLFVVVGNGDWNGQRNFSESVLKLGSTLSLLDWFTPDNYNYLNGSDLDLGVAGILLIPNTSFAVNGSKTGHLFLVRQNNLGHEQAGNGQIPQIVSGMAGHIHGAPVYWNSPTLGPLIYVWAEDDYLKAFHFNGTTLDVIPATRSSFSASAGMSGGMLSVSADGSTSGSGILWAGIPLQGNANTSVVPGVLRAFDASDLSRELWNSAQNAARDDPGYHAKFSPPTVANGKVYLTSFSKRLNVYGLLASLVGVPSVVNLTQADATTSLTTVGLVVGTVMNAASDTVPPGEVISQAPTAGTQVTVGSAVNLVVSSGPPALVNVPDVTGATQAAATTTITTAGFVVGTVTTDSSTTVAAGRIISQAPVGSTLTVQGSAIALVVSSGAPSSGPLVDKTLFADGSGARTTAAFSTSVAGELLVAFVASDGPSSGTQSVSVTGAGLTWSLVTRVNTQHGTAEIWKATAAGLLSNVTVTSTPVVSGFAQSLTVVSVSAAGGIGAVAGASAVSGAPTISLTTTQAGSLVYGVGNDWDNAIGRTVGANQTIVHQSLPAAGDTLWVQSRTDFLSAGIVGQLNDTAPTTDRWNFAAVEIVRGGSPTLVTVPSVVGTTQAAATTTLTGAGFAVGTITTASSSTVAAGLVISQNPVSGAQVAFGSAVALVVSSGPPPVSVPSVVGLTQAAASTAITTAGLVVGAVTMASSGTVAAGLVISQNPVSGAQVAAGSAVALVVSSGPPPPGPVVDKTIFSDGSGARTTAAFSTAAPGELLVAFVASSGPKTGAQATTVSGAGLSWTLVRRANTRAGTSEIWKATAVAQLSNVTVTSTPTLSGYDQSLTVVTFTGASGIGASAAANGANSAPSVSLTTTKAGALVYGVGNDWDRAVARTLGPSQTMVHQVVDSVAGATFWVQARTGPISLAGTSVQLNDTAPTNDRWNFASVEIVP